MRGVSLSIAIVLVLLVSSFVYAAPSAPPFEMDGMGDSESIDDEPTSQTSSDSSSGAQESANLPPSPSLPQSTQESTDDSQGVSSSNTAAPTTFSNAWIIGIFILLCLNFILLLIIVLSSSIHILKGKHPYLAFKYSKEATGLPQYKNTPDAIQYTETFQKLEGYMKEYMNEYSYEQIKTVLLREGFTEEEIEAVYLEVRKHVN